MVTSSLVTADRVAERRPGSSVPIGVVIAVVALAGSLTQLQHGGMIPSPGLARLDWTGAVLAVCSAAPLVVWHRFPRGVLVLTAGSGVLLAGLGYSLDLLLGPAIAIYLLACSLRPGVAWTSRMTAVVTVMFVAYVGAIAAARGTFPLSELLHTGLAWAVAWFAGERTRLRHEHIAELEDRALRVEREADRERLLAVAEERARIARDLHDSAGHAINVIAVRAGAGRLRHHQDPGRSLLALEAIEEVARQTAEEIDHLVGALRDPESARDVEAPPGLASLGTLIAHQEAAGLDVKLDRSGTPRPIGAAADQAAYRILQEALTNAARHGTGGVRIGLAHDGAGVELTVVNRVRGQDSSPSGRGHGLIGMRERATLLGGTLDTECVNGEFHVRARLPYPGHSR